VHAFLKKSGYQITKETFVARDVNFSAADEFFEAQRMICSDLRTRVELSSPLKVSAMRDEYMAKSKPVLARGGRLLYPFGAVVISATKP
jgi:hypothetical protein